MFSDIDLRELSEIQSTERVFLSIYLSGPRSVQWLEDQIEKLSRSLHGGSTEKDEREHLQENYRLVKKYLDRNAFEKGALCIFSCWALDFFKAFPLTAAVSDRVMIDSSPYIRPLAELQDEYENVAVVLADNKRARIFLVSSAVAQSEDVVKGNIKNHVRKGGWSQQRYERRRDKQLLLYAREIADALATIEKEETFRRIVLAGGKEIINILDENLPQHMKPMVARKNLDLNKAEKEVNEDLIELFKAQERDSEEVLWEKIRTEYLKNGLGIVGMADVVNTALQGRVDTVVVSRGYTHKGTRCRECDALMLSVMSQCEKCGNASLYPVDVVNELVEILKNSGGEIDFVDPIKTLSESGNVGALLRY